MNQTKRKFKKKRYRKNTAGRQKPQNGTVDVQKYVNKKSDQVQEETYSNKNGFDDFGLNPKLLANIKKSGYKHPTEIQDKSINDMMAGRDMIGIAGTGTGKTAAFLIPIINHLLQHPEDQHTLVLAPTRELANQIQDEFDKLTSGHKLYATTLIGGTNMKKSIRTLQKTNHVVIGTPGRLIDMAKRNYLHLDGFKTLVLDEFDRMLDMGFLPDMKYVVSRMKNRKQTMLFSATLDKSQKAIVEKITNNAVRITAKKGPQFTNAIEQDVVRISRGENKFEVLHKLITGKDTQKVILFCETKRKVNKLCKKLLHADIRADVIHGNKTQKAREKALNRFRKGNIQVLVATDVLARGIDVNDVSMVINYEVPKNYNDYIHRIGRTGRAGKTGKAVTMIG